MSADIFAFKIYTWTEFAHLKEQGLLKLLNETAEVVGDINCHPANAETHLVINLSLQADFSFKLF